MADWACVSCGAAKIRQHAECRCGSAGGALRSEVGPPAETRPRMTGAEAGRALADMMMAASGPMDPDTAQMVLQLRQYTPLDVVDAARERYRASLR